MHCVAKVILSYGILTGFLVSLRHDKERKELSNVLKQQ